MRTRSEQVIIGGVWITLAMAVLVLSGCVTQGVKLMDTHVKADGSVDQYAKEGHATSFAAGSKIGTSAHTLEIDGLNKVRMGQEATDINGEALNGMIQNAVTAALKAYFGAGLVP